VQVFQTIHVPLTSAILALSLAFACPARAADDVSLADLKAATRTLGFLQNFPRDKTFVLGIVWSPGSANGKAIGQQTADRIDPLVGPNDTDVRAQLIAVGDLAAHADRLDALYLVPGTAGSGAAIVDMARRKHLLVISNDPSCLDQHYCMLMVRDTGRVEIVLDSALAQSAGVTFSSVFAMMVKHR
jgi:YfiR/HmsC-like